MQPDAARARRWTVAAAAYSLRFTEWPWGTNQSRAGLPKAGFDGTAQS